MSRPPPRALRVANPASSLRSLSHRTDGAAIFKEAPGAISIVLLTSHSPGAVSLIRSGLFSFALRPDSGTFWPPLRRILSPAGSNVAARPFGAGSAGAAASAASRPQGLATSVTAAGATSRRTRASGVLLPQPVRRRPAAATRAESRRVSGVRIVYLSLNRLPAGSAAGAGSVHRSGADAGSAAPRGPAPG